MLDGLACLMVLHGLLTVTGVQRNPGIVGGVARQVNALVFSQEGARLAQAVSHDVVLCDSTTGFTLSTGSR